MHICAAKLFLWVWLFGPLSWPSNIQWHVFECMAYSRTTCFQVRKATNQPASQAAAYVVCKRYVELITKLHILVNVTQNGSSSGLVSRCCRASSCRPSYLVSVGEVESGTRPSRLGVCQFCEVPSRPTLTLITLSGSQSDNGEEKKKKRNLHVLAAKLRSAVRLREVVVTCPANRAVTATPSLWGV